MTDTTDQMPDHDLRQWQAARSIVDLGHLTARWLTGDGVTSCPGWPAGEGPEPETAQILPTLVTLNRAGMVTVASQPGHRFRNGIGQRPAVDGFCTAQTLGRIRRRLSGFEEEVRVVARRLAGRRHPTLIPCTWIGTREDLHVATVFGGLTSDVLAYMFEPVVHPTLMGQINACWAVTIFDIYSEDTIMESLLARLDPPPVRAAA
jgi:hypothetical protein